MFVPQSVEIETPRIRVPIELVDSMPFVQVRLDGAATVTALVDTGASVLALAPRVIADHRLETRSVDMRLGGIDGEQDRTVPYTLLESLELEHLIATRVHAVVLQGLDAIGESMGVHLDVLIGNALFGSMLMTIDYDRRRLVVESGALPAPDGVDVLAADFGSGVPHVVISVAGTPVDALVDTGCLDWLELPMALGPHTPLEKKTIPGLSYTTVNGPGRGHVSRLAGQVRIGRHVLVDPPVQFGPGPPRICAKLLRYFAITFDARHGRVRFRRDDPSPVVVDAQRTFGVGIFKRNETWIIGDLMPAIAPPGLEIGDVIVSVDDKPAGPLTWSEWEALKQHDVIRFTVSRGERRIVVDVPVREIGTF